MDLQLHGKTAVVTGASRGILVVMHRILLREVVVDAPEDTFAATRDFWAAALVTEAREVEEFPEFTALPDAASLSWVGLQNIGSGAARFHLDIETDDVDAEVERLTRLGGVKIADGRTWVVMRDPAGLIFDVVPYQSPWFAERSREVS
jgi:NAD(P)-dependent dehydrogenase (short-subunit alcohol dehydrogenase family)